jgi:uncharacterized protein (DUF362 family)
VVAAGVGCGSDDNASTATGGTAGAGGSGGTGSSRVALVRDPNNDFGQAVRDAVAMVGGFPNLTGQTVLLKPNLNSGDPFPYSTNPAVVVAAIQMVLERGATRVIVADRSNPSYSTITAFQTSGITAAINALGLSNVEMMDLNTQPTTVLTPAGATHWTGGFTTYSLLVDGTVDYIINLPACKHHGMANFTMSLKAWMGIHIQANRITAHNDLGSRLPEFHLGVRENFIIMDATKACLTGGPGPGGQQASPGIVVASGNDNVANDVTGVAILRYYLAQAGITNSDLNGSAPTPWNQPQILRAIAIGLGITSRQAYSYQAQGISEIDAIMAQNT